MEPSAQQNPAATTSSFFDNNQIQFLQQHGFTTGLIKLLEKDRIKITKRCWILDNSNSMNVMDSHRLAGSYDNIQDVTVTRWEELIDCVSILSNIATTLHMPTRFALLNDPGPNVGSQYFCVAENVTTSNTNIGLILQEEINNVRKIMTTLKPSGPTNLVKTLSDLRTFIIQSKHPMVSIVIATQGLPTNEYGQSGPAITQQFIQTLQSFQGLPVSICIRICTDNDRAIEFYNNLEQQLHPSLPYNVMDDLFGESLEVYLKNPWLTYGLPLHRFRELGFHHKVFGILDDKALTPMELRDFCMLFFSVSATVTLPDPCLYWDAFFNMVSNLVAKERHTWNPVTRKLSPWINLTQLQKIYGMKSDINFNVTSTKTTTGFDPYGAGAVGTSSDRQNVNQTQQAIPTMSTSYQQQQEQTYTQNQSSMHNQVPSQQQTMPSAAPKPSPPSMSTAPPPPSINSGNNNMSAPEDDSLLKKTVLIQWALLPPTYSLRPINHLLGNLQNTFPPAFGIEKHDYFSMKWKPLSQDALLLDEYNVIKRALRKAKFFLHPDKLPKEFNAKQSFLCKLLWDVLADAWEIFEKKQ